MKEKQTLYVVMPAYNEEKNITTVVKQWYPVLRYGDENSRLVVADFGSTDRTHEVLLDLQKEYPKLETLNTKYKEHGPKLLSLYAYAAKQGADYIFQTDSDGQTNPTEFARFWNLRSYHDAIIGNRAVRGDGKMRAFVEFVVCSLLFVFFGVNVPDANAPFRLMKSDLVSRHLDRLPEDYYLPNIMLVAYFSYYHEDIAFQKISFSERLQGENTIDMKAITKIGLRALYDFWQFRKDMR